MTPWGVCRTAPMAPARSLPGRPWRLRVPLARPALPPGFRFCFLQSVCTRGSFSVVLVRNRSPPSGTPRACRGFRSGRRREENLTRAPESRETGCSAPQTGGRQATDTGTSGRPCAGHTHTAHTCAHARTHATRMHAPLTHATHTCMHTPHIHTSTHVHTCTHTHAMHTLACPQRVHTHVHAPHTLINEVSYVAGYSINTQKITCVSKC